MKCTAQLATRLGASLNSHAMTLARQLLLVAAVLQCVSMAGSLAVVAQPRPRQETADGLYSDVSARPIKSLVQLLTKGSFSLVDGAGKVLGTLQQDNKTPKRLSVDHIIRTLRTSILTPRQATKLWDFAADEYNSPLITLPFIESLIIASNTPKGRAPLWSDLAYLTRELRGKRARRAKSLLGFFERHRAQLRPLLGSGRDTELGGDEMIDVMLSSRVFGDNLRESLAWVGEHNPAPIARRIEFERGRGRPVHWENAALQAILRWKNAHFSADTAYAPETATELNAAGRTFTIILNNFRDMSPAYRNAMLKGLKATDAFNIVIGGEFELYRMGTSSFRQYLYPAIMTGIKEHGTFEAFVKDATPERLNGELADILGRRSMDFLRVASTFGLLEQVLETVHDSQSLVGHSLTSLGDAATFRRNGSVIVDLLTAPSTTPKVAAFKKVLADKLYERYRSEGDARLRTVYGSILSVYQSITGNKREASIDQAFPVDASMFRIPFARLFSKRDDSVLLHRMFMRMDEDTDAVTTYAGFDAMMRFRGASVLNKQYYVVYRFRSGERRVEIYVNKPTHLGISRGIADIGAALHGKKVQTAIGRGHTYIIGPFLRDSKLILGNQVKDVATVLIGSCGGEASMSDIVKTFGYMSVVVTRSTGRQLINNAIIGEYVTALMALKAGGHLFLQDVLKKAVAQFARLGTDSDLHDDAKFYRVSMEAVMIAQLFDKYLSHVNNQSVALSR